MAWNPPAVQLKRSAGDSIPEKNDVARPVGERRQSQSETTENLVGAQADQIERGLGYRTAILEFSTAMCFGRPSDEHNPSPIFMYKPSEISEDMLWSPPPLATAAMLHV